MLNSTKNAIRGAFWTKPFIVLVLLLLLLIPLSFIDNLTYSRSETKQLAQDSILTPVGGELQIQGLAIVVPYTEIIEAIDKSNNELVKRRVEKNFIIVPKNYSLAAEIDPTYLKRGIFRVPIYNGDFALKADFEAINYTELGVDPARLNFDEAVLVLGVGNQKSFTASPTLSLNGKELKQYHGNTEAKIFDRSLIYKLPASALPSDFSISGTLKIQGGEALHLAPIAQNSRFEISSTWASPSFGGGFIAKSREVSASGFKASWEVTGLAAGIAPAWLADQDDRVAMTNWRSNDDRNDAVSIGFIEPVNNYSLIKRCTDYALLFLAVPFLAIFLCEVYTHERIHPIQYLLIGLEDVVFYLLVLSLSEHIGFAISYAISAIAVSAIVFFYASAIFKGARWGIFITCVQLVSYAILYVILNSEDYALLMGSLMIFAVISLVMYFTRKLDWYDTAIPSGEKKQEQEPEI